MTIPVPEEPTREHFWRAIEVFHLRQGPWTGAMLDEGYGFPASTGFTTEEVYWAANILRKLRMPGKHTVGAITSVVMGSGEYAGFRWTGRTGFPPKVYE